MTNYNNTDKIIKEKYEAVNPVFDADAMWADLAPMVEQKKRRGILFWASGLMIILFSLLSIIGLQQYEAYPIDPNIANDKLVNPQNSNLAFDNSMSPVAETVSSNFSLEEEKTADPMKVDLEVSIEKVEDLSVMDNNSKKSKLHNEVTDFYFDSKVVNLPQFEDDFVQLSTPYESEKNNNYTLDEVDIISRELLTMPKISSVKISSLEYTSTNEIKSDSKFIESTYTQPLLKKEWRLGLNGGYYTHSRSFENAGDDTSDNYINRSLEEKAKDGYDLGIKFEYFLTDNFVILGGARFSQSFVQRIADYEYTETITLEDYVVKIIITEEGPFEVKETITYDGVFNHRADNYITATRLGLITGIQYRVGANRWTSHFDLGIELPVWSSHSGIITNNRRPYNLTEDTEAINASSLQIFGGVGMEYSLSESTAIQATIGGYMPFNNEHVESYAIEKKSTLLGLNLGIHFRL